MNNNSKHKSYEWYLQFDEITWIDSTGVEGPSCVNEENKKVWRRYLNRLFSKLFRLEVMTSSELLEISQVTNSCN